MVQSVLGSLLLGYRPLWSRARSLAGIQLYVQNAGLAEVDIGHLLRTVHELWTASSPPLLLSPLSRQLLCDMHEHAPRGTPWIEVRSDWLGDSAVHSRVKAAWQRGLKLVWRGPLSRLPEPDTARCFDNSLLSLTPEEAVAALKAGVPGSRAGAVSPIIDGQMYEGIPSRALMQHCLDQHRALALAGWPTDDLLHQMRHQPMQPSHHAIAALMKAIDQEQSIDSFEDLLAEDPLLAYRFLLYTNSAAVGLRTGIDTLRRGLVMMGYGQLQRWLSDQRPFASTEPDLEPVRQALVIRARLTSHLLNAGIEHELRREVYLCGLFSQLDLLMREPMGTCLHRIPLSQRIYDAIVLHSGPYSPALEMACALETDDASAIRSLCETHELDREEVNRALLRVLSDLEVRRPAPSAVAAR